MRAEFQKPRGTQDVLPPMSQKMEHMRRIALDCAQRFGYFLVETPVFEQTPVFLRVGESTDIVQHERYSFTDSGGVNLTLRPEGTAAVARAYVENGMYNQPQPVRMCYYGPMFRRERPQALRYRQHTQFGAELYGSVLPEADAEVILLACAVVEEVGLADPVIRMNSIGCSICRPRYREALIRYYNQRQGELCQDCQSRLKSNPLRLLDCKIDVDIRENAPDIEEFWCEDCSSHYKQLVDLLSSAGRTVVRDPFLVRGLDYYTRTVFEISHPSMGSQAALFGGGRYDGLATTLDGPESTPAVGFGMGIERMLSAVEEKFTISSQMRIYVAHLPGFEGRSLVLAEQLRREGFAAESDLLGRSLKAQLRDAGRRSQVVVIIGGQEWDKGEVSVKWLQDGVQTTIRREQLGDWLREKREKS